MGKLLSLFCLLTNWVQLFLQGGWDGLSSCFSFFIIPHQQMIPQE